MITIYRSDTMWKKYLQSFCEQYKEDMPSIGNMSHEGDNWESLLLKYPKDRIPSTVSDAIKVANPVSFPKYNNCSKDRRNSTKYKLHL